MQVRATRLSATGGHARRMSLNPATLFTKAGRSGLCYTAKNGGVSWDDLIAESVSMVAAGTPELAPLFADSGKTTAVTYPIGAGQGWGWLRDLSGAGNHASQVTAAARGEFSRRYNQWTATAALATQAISTITAQYRMYFTGAGSITLSGAASGVYTAGSHLITCTDGTLTATVAGSVLTADLRFQADAAIGGAYQRVTTASDYDEVGYPTYHRAVTDDWAKAHVNPDGATQSLLLSSWQKIGHTKAGVLFEVSPNFNSYLGSLVTFSNLSDLANGGPTAMVAASRGSLPVVTGLNVSPGARVFSSQAGSISTSLLTVKVNNEIITKPDSQGTGSYTAQDVFVNSRSGTTLFADARSFAPSMLIYMQTGDSLTAGEITKLEAKYKKAAGVS